MKNVCPIFGAEDSKATYIRRPERSGTARTLGAFGGSMGSRARLLRLSIARFGHPKAAPFVFYGSVIYHLKTTIAIF